MFKRKGPSDLERAKENEIKHGISQELSATLKQLQKDNIGTEDQTVYSTDSANAVCNCLEAVFLHGLKGNRVKKIANYMGLGSQAQQQSNLNFWTLAVKFTHGEVVSQLKHLGQITTEIGLCRSWVRMALNDGLMESYIDAMVADKKTLEQYYHSTAYLRDQEHPEIIKTYLHGLMTFQFKLSYNASVLNEWSYQPLIMAGVIDSTDAPPPVIKPAVARQPVTASPSKKIIQDDTNIEVRKVRSRSRDELKNPMEQPAIGQQRGSPFQISSSEFTSKDVEAFKRLTYEQTALANSECSSSSHISMPDTPHLNLSPAAYCQETLAQPALSEQEQGLGDDYSIVGEATDSAVTSSGTDPTIPAAPTSDRLDDVYSEQLSSHVESATDDEDKRGLEESWEDFYRSVDRAPQAPQDADYKRMESLQRDIMEEAIVSGFVDTEEPELESGFVDTEEPVLQVSSTTVVGSVGSEGVERDGAEDLLVSSLKEAAEDFVEAMEKVDVKEDGVDGEIVTVEDAEVEERLKCDPDDEQEETGVLEKGAGFVEERIKVSKDDDERVKLEKKIKKQRKKLHMKKLKPVFSAPDIAPLEPQPTEAIADTLDTAPMDIAENFSHSPHRLSLPIARYLRDPKKSKRTSLPNVDSLAEIYDGQPIVATEEDDTMTEAEETLRTSQLNKDPRQSIGNSLTTGRGWSSSFDSEHDDTGGAFSPPRPSSFSPPQPSRGLLSGAGSPQTQHGSPSPVGPSPTPGVSSSPIVCGTSPRNTSLDTGRRKSESFGTLLQNYTPSSSLSAPSIEDVLHNFPRKETILSPKRSPTGEDQDNLDGFEVVNTSDNPDPDSLEHLSQLVEIAQEKGLDAQNFQCKGCARTIGMIFGKPRVCRFDGGYYCYECHENDEYYIPAVILHNWDFRKQKVCKKALGFLQEIEEQPHIDLEKVNPRLYDHVPEMQEVRTLRQQLLHLKTYLFTCKQSIAEDLRRLAWPRDYLFESIDSYSLSDLLQVPTGALATSLRKMIKFATKHVYGCGLCSQKGFICELCNNPKVIYVFELDATYRCPQCRSVFHKECKTDNRPCPKCQRRAQREATHGVIGDLTDYDFVMH